MFRQAEAREKEAVLRDARAVNDKVPSATIDVRDGCRGECRGLRARAQPIRTNLSTLRSTVSPA